MARVRNTVIDVAVLAVIVGLGAAFIAFRHDQTRYDGPARAIAAWSRAEGVTRVAWPQAQRAAVPTLLHQHVTPVLVDAQHLVPQTLAVNDTAVVVMPRAIAASPVLQAATRDLFRAGVFVARRVDLVEAARVPLAPGQSVGEEISRPYVYAPLRNSLVVSTTSPFTAHLTLDAGRYVVRVDAFAQQRARLRIIASRGSATIQDGVFGVRSVFLSPTMMEFTSPAAGSITVTFTTLGPAGSRVLVHGWSVERTTA